MEKPKVLFLTNMYPKVLGGTFIHDQATHLISAGCKVKVLVPVPYVPNILIGRDRWQTYAKIPYEDTIDMVSIDYPRYLRLPGKWFHSISCYSQYWGLKKRIRTLMDEFRPNILHAHAATAPGYIGLMIKKIYGLPLVCSLRGCDINTYPYYGTFSMNFTKKLIAEADQLLSVSGALKEAANTFEKPKREIKVVYNGCNIDSFIFRKEDRLQIRGELGISESDKVLVFIGSLSEDKGVVELLTAFTKLIPNKEHLHLMIIGNGPEKTRIQNDADTLIDDGKVHIIGERAHREIPKYLSAADLFVLPSYSEGLPNVILEAMACNLPVIATRVGGIPEAVEDGKSGILVEKKDAVSLKGAIEYLLDNEARAREMGVFGRRIAETKFNWTENAKKTIDIYGELLNAKN